MKAHWDRFIVIAAATIFGWPVCHGIGAPEFTGEQREWWAFQPLTQAAPPVVDDVRWGENEIDRWVYTELVSHGLSPSQEAERSEIARRVYFDLTGLPPKPEELEAFLTDESADAYGKLVDRLLASPRYGERWAQHWLDLVRYAESDGFRADAYRPEAWPYRDYVIAAFNTDKPYDEFVREQLAGDEMDLDNPDVLVATGFLRHGIYEYNGRDVRGQWDGILNEVTDVTADVFLGLSFQCARCHDHKFDPILQADYFRLKAFFSPLAWRDDLKLATSDEKRDYENKLAVWDEATKEIRVEMETIIGGELDKSREEAVEKFPEDIQVIMRKPAGERDVYEEQLARLAHRQVVYEEERFKADSIKGEPGERYKVLSAELEKFAPLKPKELRPAFVATDMGGEAPRTSFSSKRGEVEVQPGYLSILDGRDAEVTKRDGVAGTGRRTTLAEWITQPDNPLSTRVIVNRVWQLHFGRGIVSTPSDFGKLGEPPSHPELLDWLARTFVEDGWSLKKLHRRILTSATYRQTARREPGKKEAVSDPQNRLLWKFSPRRLDAGEARDALLMVSGELELKSGGPSQEGGARCRSIFLKKVRNTPDEFLSQFDGPAGFNSEPMRNSTTTPTQSLLMINSEWAVARSKKMAVKLLTDAGGNLDKTVAASYATLFGRDPQREEIADATGFIHAMESRLSTPPKAPEKVVGTALAKVEAQFTGAEDLGLGSHAFPFDGASDRLEVGSEVDEGESQAFTAEAVANLESLYDDSSVRTLVSRWNGQPDGSSAQNSGWGLGVTSTRSRYGPRNLIVQLVGEDFQGNLTYEVVASDLRVPLGKPFYVAAVISMLPTPENKTGGTVQFFLRDLSAPDGEIQVVTVPHMIKSGLRIKGRKLVIGGRDAKDRSLFHGEIARVQITAGMRKKEGVPFSGGDKVVLGLKAEGETVPDGVGWMQSRSEAGSGTLTPRQQAVADFCHVLMNSNEFLYLH